MDWLHIRSLAISELSKKCLPTIYFAQTRKKFTIIGTSLPVTHPCTDTWLQAYTSTLPLSELDTCTWAMHAHTWSPYTLTAKIMFWKQNYIYTYILVYISTLQKTKFRCKCHWGLLITRIKSKGHTRLHFCILLKVLFGGHHKDCSYQW